MRIQHNLFLPVKKIPLASIDPKRQAVLIQEVLPPIYTPITFHDGTTRQTRIYPIAHTNIKNNNLADAIENHVRQSHPDAKIARTSDKVALNFFYRLYTEIRKNAPIVLCGSLPDIRNIRFVRQSQNHYASYKTNRSIYFNLNAPSDCMSGDVNILFHELGHVLDIINSRDELSQTHYFRTAAYFLNRKFRVSRLPLTRKEFNRCFPGVLTPAGNFYLGKVKLLRNNYNYSSYPSEFIMYFWECLLGPNRQEYHSYMQKDMFIKNAVRVLDCVALFSVGVRQTEWQMLLKILNNFHLSPDTEKALITFDNRLKKYKKPFSRQTDKKTKQEIIQLCQQANNLLIKDGQNLYRQINKLYQTTQKQMRSDLIRFKRLSNGYNVNNLAGASQIARIRRGLLLNYNSRI